jgi:gamma-glutamyltranspeptidase/glutathione hydrolase
MEPTAPRSGHPGWARQSGLVLALLLLAGCKTATGLAEVTGGRFGGAVAADEPRAALAAREILDRGGSAADAAVALGFALTATLPSRAGLGGGGVCVARDGVTPDDTGVPIGLSMVTRTPPIPKAVAFTFVPQALPDKPEIGQPLLARGLAALHGRFGRLRWEQVVTPAENLARFGTPTSRALARDIEVAGINIPGPNGQPLREGVPIFLPELAQSLGAIRTKGGNELNSGALAQAFARGFGIDPAGLRAAVPTSGDPLMVKSGRDRAYFPPAEGGSYAAALFETAREDRRGRSDEPAARAAALHDAAAKLAARFPTVEGPAPTTGFAVVDWRGGAVVCSLTMGSLFGTQLIAPGTGIIASKAVTAGSPAARGLTAMLVSNDNTGQFIAGFGAGEDGAAPQSLVQVALATLGADRPLQQAQLDFRAGSGVHLGEAEPERQPSVIDTAQSGGLVNAVVCRDGLPRNPESCSAQHDPRGHGLSVSAEPRR